MLTFNQILESVIYAFQEVFPDSIIDNESDFFDLGGDSLVLLSLITILETSIGIDIPPTALLYHTSVEEFSTEIERLLISDDLKSSN